MTLLSSLTTGHQSNPDRRRRTGLLRLRLAM